MRRYRGNISGPLLDRIDLHVEVARPDRIPQAHTGPMPEDSATVRRRVIAARQIQLERGGVPNAQLGSGAVKKFCGLDAEKRGFLEAAAEGMGLSPRACQRILKVSRTLADLDGADDIRSEHLAEAIAYRGIDCGNQ